MFKQTSTTTYHYLTGDKPIKYMTVEDCIRSNGERHLERAIAYISAGYPDRFADGSLRKAKRELKKADYFNFKLHPKTQAIIDSFKIMIANNIMKG